MNILRYIAGIFYPNTQLKIADNPRQYDWSKQQKTKSKH